MFLPISVRRGLDAKRVSTGFNVREKKGSEKAFKFRLGYINSQACQRVLIQKSVIIVFVLTFACDASGGPTRDTQTMVQLWLSRNESLSLCCDMVCCDEVLVLSRQAVNWRALTQGACVTRSLFQMAVLFRVMPEALNPQPRTSSPEP